MGANLLGQQMNIGGIQRDITGQQMQEPYQKWQTEQPYNNPYLQMIASLSQSAPRMDYTAQQQAPGMFSQMMPGIGSALGGYFMGGGTLGGMGSSLIPGGLGGLAGGLGGLATGAGGAALGGLGALAGLI